MLYMKILVFSDIHGAIEPLEKMISIFENEKYDLMLIAGDFLNHGPRNGLPPNYDPKKCAELLNRYGDKIVCVRGNCDSEVDQMMMTFPVLCETTQLFFKSDCATSTSTSTSTSTATATAMRIFMHHGHRYDYESVEKMLPPSDDKSKTIVLSGHTHIPVLEEKDGYIFLNPGSITFPKGGSKAGYAKIETESCKIELCELK